MNIRREIVQRALWERYARAQPPSPDSGERERILCVPLVGVERTIGVLYMIGGRAVGRMSKKIMSTF